MITSEYNYLLQNYTPRSNTPYDIHKKSELRNIYGTIVKKSLQSPLYMVKLSEDKQQFALDLKDTALSLKSSLSAVSQNNEDSVFSTLKAYSDQPDRITAEIISNDITKLPDSLQINVNNLAATQKNESAVVYENGFGPQPGSYHFQIETEDSSYEFQFNIGQNGLKHGEVLTKLSNFINKSNIGIHAKTIRHTKEAKVFMRLESEKTGNTGSTAFSLKDVSSPRKDDGLVHYYDLNRVTTFPVNASFSINNKSRESMSNQFVLNNSLQIELKAATEQSCQIVYQADADKILESVGQIADTYNSLINLADRHLSDQRLAGKLTQELKNITSLYKNELESAGINLEQDGTLSIDTSLASQSAREGDLQKLFGSSSSFAGRLSAKMSMISIDPMEYIDKTLVTYPNTAKPGTANPYMISIYSGMLFNYYL